MKLQAKEDSTKSFNVACLESLRTVKGESPEIWIHVITLCKQLGQTLDWVWDELEKLLAVSAKGPSQVDY